MQDRRKQMNEIDSLQSTLSEVGSALSSRTPSRPRSQGHGKSVNRRACEFVISMRRRIQNLNCVGSYRDCEKAATIETK